MLDSCEDLCYDKPSSQFVEKDMSGIGNTARFNVLNTGDAAIDGLLTGRAWTGAITYSFPTASTEYGTTYQNDTSTTDFAGIGAAQQAVFYFALDADLGNAAAYGFSVEGFTNLDISLTTDEDANIRGAESSVPGTAFAYYPGQNYEEAGDIWFGTAYDYTAPDMGDYSFLTHIHEIGHALGLEHAHEGQVMPLEYDHLAYTVMSYRSFEGGSTTSGYTNGAFGYPQSFMMMDIAALQHMYGADYTVYDGDTTYTWSPITGETFINGVSVLNAGDDTIFATLWDGGGVDTYDLSNYTTDMLIDLRDGAYSAFSTAQLASLNFSGALADGNIYNALMFEGNTASLIENAEGGSGDDVMVANQADNVLDGNGGVNSVSYIHDTIGVTLDLTIGTANGAGTGTDSILNFVHATGGSGDDVMTGTSGANTLIGGEGDDTILGGGGADMIDGGDGMDTASYLTSTNRVDVSLLAGTATGAQATGDVLSSIESLTGSAFGDSLKGNNAINILNGEGGKDTLIGYNGDDSIFGGAGRDILNGGNGADILDGGAGVDQARYNGSTEAVQIDLLAGTATGGQAEGDTLISIENLFGSNHNDTLYGDTNNNKIFGHNGDDALAAGGGISKLFGGSGSDSFVLSDGFGFVMDFVDDVDQLDVSAYGFSTMAEALANLDQVGDNARFRVGDDVLLILDTDANDLMDDIVI